MTIAAEPLGEHLRRWRRRRRLSQLDLALDSEISTRHLSFLETGRSRPSRAMVLRLAERLDVPLRERNVLLTAAGFAPVFPHRELTDPALGAARQALERLIAAHEPYPALAVDRHWMLLAANAAVARLLTGLPPALLAPPVNVLRLSLHPDGLAPSIVNLSEWRAHLLDRLGRQIEATADRVLEALAAELNGYPAASRPEDAAPTEELGGLAVPLHLRTMTGTLSFLSATTVFGTALDVTLSELTLETFLPADEATARVLLGQASGPSADAGPS